MLMITLSFQSASVGYQQDPYADPYFACQLAKHNAKEELDDEELEWFIAGCAAGFCLGPIGFLTPLFVSSPDVKNVSVLYNMTPQSRLSYEDCYKREGKKKLQEAALEGAITGCLIPPIAIIISTLITPY